MLGLGGRRVSRKSHSFFRLFPPPPRPPGFPPFPTSPPRPRHRVERGAPVADGGGGGSRRGLALHLQHLSPLLRRFPRQVEATGTLPCPWTRGAEPCAPFHPHPQLHNTTQLNNNLTVHINWVQESFPAKPVRTCCCSGEIYNPQGSHCCSGPESDTHGRWPLKDSEH